MQLGNPTGGGIKMTTVTRRGLLQIGAGTAGALGISTLATELNAMSGLAQPESEKFTGSMQAPAPAEMGTELFYKDDWLGAPWVKPETALLIHGNDETSVSWFGWVPGMAQEFRLIRPDLPGFGNSAIPQNYEWSMPSLATTLARLLDRIGVDAAHIIGAKTGGAIGMQFAADYPQRTRTLTIVSGPVTRVASGLPFSAPSSSAQQRRLGTAASKELVDYWNTLMGSTKPQTKAGMAKVEEALNMETVLPRIAAPTLVITTDRSALQSVETVLRYQQKIANSRLLVIPSDGYHVAVIKPDECVSNVLSFIKETKRGA
jgi:3-oxoadipate enol-lactonase